MITIRQILAHKGGNVVGIDGTVSLAAAARTMSERGVGALAVRAGEAIVGVLSERDLVLCLAKLGATAADATAATVMQPALTIAIDDELMAGLHLMTNRRRRHLLVQQDGQIIGMVSIGDLVKAIHEEQVGTISSLHQYITG